MKRKEVFERGSGRFEVFGIDAVASFGRMCEELNPSITVSENQLARAISTLARRWTEKLENRSGAPPPEERPRVETIDITAFLNSCKE